MIEVQVTDVSRQLHSIDFRKQQHLDLLNPAAKRVNSANSRKPSSTAVPFGAGSSAALSCELHFQPDTLLFAGSDRTTAELVESNYSTAHKIPKDEASVNEELQMANSTLRDTIVQLLKESDALLKENERLKSENERLRFSQQAPAGGGFVGGCAAGDVESALSAANSPAAAVSTDPEEEICHADEDMELPPLDLPDIDFESLRVDN